MKFIFLLFFLNLSLLGNDFITLKEYAKMLYENPRGIGCNRCHGEDGSEQILGYTLQKDKKVPFVVPSIQNLSYKEFARSLNEEKESKSVMPTYFLTPNEITTLYNYIQEKSKEKKR